MMDKKKHNHNDGQPDAGMTKKECLGEVEQLQEKVAELEKKCAERNDIYEKYVRLSAEFDNARKRMEKEKQDFVKYANDGLINDLFPILDSFDSAVTSVEKTEKSGPVIEGLRLLQSKFHKVLEDQGLKVMSCVGEKFDPIKHEAVMKVADDRFDDGVVCEEIRKGYTLNGRVLRPAMVKVAETPQEAGPETENSDEK